MAESREIIKNRMLKTAAKVWGLQGVEDETSFDPLVQLLVNACAVEIEKISREADVSQTRLLEKLSHVLTPDVESGAVPAHGIICASSAEPCATITNDHQFVLYAKESAQEENPGDLYFSPAGNYLLYSGEVKYMIARDTLFEFTDSRFREPTAVARQGQRATPSAIYIGLSLDKKTEEVKDLSFYFDIKNDTYRDLFYHYLSLSEWTTGGSKLDSITGISFSEPGQLPDVEHILSTHFRMPEKISGQINRFYNRRFITIKNIPDHAKLNQFPETLKDVFDPKDIARLSKDILWVKVQFAEAVTDDLLKNVFCGINCFPALNRKTYEFTHRLQKNLNIIPLKSDEYFFDIKKVSDTDNKLYHQRPLTGNSELGEGEMVLRTTGVGRFDSKNASELMHSLVEALRNESASFSIFGTEALSANLAELNKIIGNLEEKIHKAAVKESVSYIMVKNREANKSLFVEFWSTNGEEANNLKPGTTFDSLKGINIRNNTAVLMTTTVGGRNRLSEEEKVNALKKSLISKGRVVSEKDIKFFCFDYLGNRITRVEIRKGVTYDNGRSSGLRRTIEVLLFPRKDANTTGEEWDYLLEDIRNRIEEVASASVPFKFILEKN